MKLKGSVASYLNALEDEIDRVKSQRGGVPFSHSEYLKNWDEYLAHLENLRVEACLLMDFEEDDVTGHEDTVAEAILLADERGDFDNILLENEDGR